MPDNRPEGIVARQPMAKALAPNAASAMTFFVMVGFRPKFAPLEDLPRIRCRARLRAPRSAPTFSQAHSKSR
jgi:hypothetical protein